MSNEKHIMKIKNYDVQGDRNEQTEHALLKFAHLVVAKYIQ